MSAETNLIKKADLAKAREIDFVEKFVGDGFDDFLKLLDITRKIPMTAGTRLTAYKAKGELEDGNVAEGEIIPLSHFETEKVEYDEIPLNKWRKAVSGEAILKSGYAHAVTATNKKMLGKVRSKIRTQFFDFLNGLTGTAAEGEDLQAVLADMWGEAQILYEDDAVEMVYMVNPRDVANYLKTAEISTQTVFGLKYVEDFLGLGTVFISSKIPQGTVKATAKENIVFYYIPIDEALNEAFDFTTDESGLIGIHEFATYEREQAEILINCGITLFVERTDGVITGTISAAGA